MIDGLLDELYQLVMPANGTQVLPSHMYLHRDPGRPTYFTPAPRPVMTRDDMEAVSNGIFAVMAEILAELPPETRDQVIGKLKQIHAALKAEQASGSESSPSCLIYAMY